MGGVFAGVGVKMDCRVQQLAAPGRRLRSWGQHQNCCAVCPQLKLCKTGVAIYWTPSHFPPSDIDDIDGCGGFAVGALRSHRFPRWPLRNALGKGLCKPISVRSQDSHVEWVFHQRLDDLGHPTRMFRHLCLSVFKCLAAQCHGFSIVAWNRCCYCYSLGLKRFKGGIRSLG
ncbi:hypothetical protein ALO75_200111 [Pseudomonas syringae pv. coryli]|uniref:Transposase n=1 Tax=Pseudomonas syringae pv. coryli TaxID=317659 RepID=A0A0P9P7G2_9PSED|nr:hypothetical protein ALO75_200111 [Pseudomonas syringae pv. coryli]